MSPSYKIDASVFELTTEQLLETTIVSLDLVPFANKDDSLMGKMKRLYAKTKGSSYICNVRRRDEKCSLKAILELNNLKKEVKKMLNDFRTLSWPLSPSRVSLRDDVESLMNDIEKLREVLCEIPARRNYNMKQCEEDEERLRVAAKLREEIDKRGWSIYKAHRMVDDMGRLACQRTGIAPSAQSSNSSLQSSVSNTPTAVSSLYASSNAMPGEPMIVRDCPVYQYPTVPPVCPSVQVSTTGHSSNSTRAPGDDSSSISKRAFHIKSTKQLAEQVAARQRDVSRLLPLSRPTAVVAVQRIGKHGIRSRTARVDPSSQMPGSYIWTTESNNQSAGQFRWDDRSEVRHPALQDQLLLKQRHSNLDGEYSKLNWTYAEPLEKGLYVGEPVSTAWIST